MELEGSAPEKKANKKGCRKKKKKGLKAYMHCFCLSLVEQVDYWVYSLLGLLID